MRDAGADAIGVDYRVPLDEASLRLGGQTPLQGNLDPSLLAAPDDVLDAAVGDVLERGLTAPGHVFNLGHGVPPSADPDRLTRIVDIVHAWRPSADRG
jgi:uroporphyrinogen decarboxylase